MAHVTHVLLILVLSLALTTRVDSQLDSNIQISPQDMAGLQGIWEAWRNNTPNVTRNLHNWGNYSALPCNDDVYYEVDLLGWLGVGCEFQQNATSSVWNASVAMLIFRGFPLKGVLPPELSLLSNLQYLILRGNPGLTGPIPKEIGLLTGLNTLDLSRCNFTGQVPDFTNLTNLVTIDLSSNGFVGPFPTPPAGWKLEQLNISGNLFEGVIPQDVFRSMDSYLVSLDLSNNKFTCPLPNFSSGLETLNLANNRFTCLTPDFTSFPGLTTLNLSSNLFEGLSKNLSSFSHVLPQSLSVLDLSSVNIGGSVPEWSSLAPSSTISELYLDNNNLTGILNISALAESAISRSLKVLSLKENLISNVLTSDDLIRKGQIKILLQGNPYCNKIWSSQVDVTWCSIYCEDLCKYTPKSKNGWRVRVILATSLSSVVILMIVILGLAFTLRRNRKFILALQRRIKEADISAKRFDYNELRVATRNFAPEMKLGAGAYGAVYKGILVNNVVVAVKQLFRKTNEGSDDFVNEVLLIANLKHRNLVTLKGYCLHGKQTLLVYEYVDNCDLDKLLLRRHSSAEGTRTKHEQVLNWEARLKVCQGVAQGLYYLHASSQSRIIHRDIKASNILLDKNLQPKIADFGLARPIEDAHSVIITQQCAGTLGYLAPEYMCHGELSEKADVFSFGVLLLEIVSGKRNRDLTMPEDEVYLPTRAWKLHRENRLLDMKDSTVDVSGDEAVVMQRVLETAVLCVQNAPEKRPSMFQVAAMLAGNATVDGASKAADSPDDYYNWHVERGMLDQFDSSGNPLFTSSPSVGSISRSRGPLVTNSNATIELSMVHTGSNCRSSKVEVPKPARIRSFGASSADFAIKSSTGVLANGFQRC